MENQIAGVGGKKPDLALVLERGMEIAKEATEKYGNSWAAIFVETGKSNS